MAYVPLFGGLGVGGASSRAIGPQVSERATVNIEKRFQRTVTFEDLVLFSSGDSGQSAARSTNFSTTNETGWKVDGAGNAWFYGTVIFGSSVTFGSDLWSDNWNGSNPADLSSNPDSGASTGYYLDYSAGAAQFQKIYAEGGEIGNLDVTGALSVEATITLGTNGVFRSGSGNQRVEITAAENDMIRFHSGQGDETSSARILSAGATNGPYLDIWGPIEDYDAYSDLNQIRLATTGAAQGYGIGITSIGGRVRLDSRGNEAGGTGAIDFYIGGNHAAKLTTSSGLTELSSENSNSFALFRGSNKWAQANSSYTNLYNPSGATRLWISDVHFYVNATTHYFRDTSSNEKFRIDSAGNIHQKGAYHYRTVGGNDWCSFDDTNNQWYWYTDNGFNMTLDVITSSRESLGINDSTPDATFDCDVAQNLTNQYAGNGTSGTATQAEWRSDWSVANQVQCLIQADGDLYNRNGTYGTISDRKFKVEESIHDARDYSDDLRRIRPQKYLNKNVEGERLGYVAQEVQKVKPGFVKEATFTTYERERVPEYLPRKGRKGPRQQIGYAWTYKRKDGKRVGKTEEALAVKTALFIPMLHSGWLAHDERLFALEARVAELEAQLAAL